MNLNRVKSIPKWTQLPSPSIFCAEVSMQLSIDTSVAQLQQQVEYLQIQLESERQEHIQEIQQIQKFQALLQHITEHILDSLDDRKILTIITQELVDLLQLNRCQIELYNPCLTSVNLLELKECLQQAAYGLADDKINEYIDKIEKEIKLRSEIIKTVKELSAQNNDNSQTTHQQVTVTEIRVHYNAINKQNLTNEITHDLLIELSSPLTGYLGREKANDGKTDKFYYLRDLPIN